MPQKAFWIDNGSEPFKKRIGDALPSCVITWIVEKFTFALEIDSGGSNNLCARPRHLKNFNHVRQEWQLESEDPDTAAGASLEL